MNINDVVDTLLNPAPAWMHPKPCAVCRMDFVPADPRQECCPQHHRQLIESVRASFSAPEVQS